jgi:hypothetical protein
VRGEGGGREEESKGERDGWVVKWTEGRIERRKKERIER